MKNVKKALYQHALEVISERLIQTKQSIDDALESVMEDEKSSVGDKYETGREMAQQEVDKHQSSYENLSKMQAALRRIDPSYHSDIVENGALVITDKNNLYISVGLGRLELDGQAYLLISRSAPLMEAFSGKKAGDKVTFNNNTFTIKEIY